MVHGIVAGKTLADVTIGAQLVGHQPTLGIGCPENHAAQSSGGDVLNLAGTRPAAALDEGNDRNAVTAGAALLPAKLRMQNPGRAALPVDGVGFVRLDDRPFAAQRPRAAVVRHHRFADAMADEPSGFEINTEDAAELICAKTLLRGAHQVHGLQPNVHRHMAFLEDGADLDGEWLPTGVAFVDADPSALALQFAALADRAAVRAGAPALPDDRFDVGIGRVFVAKTRLVKDGLRHRSSPYRRTYNA
jgi:hypothetical protein